jgi:hypothetical protein
MEYYNKGRDRARRESGAVEDEDREAERMENSFGEESGLDEGLKFSLAAALSRQYAEDQRGFMTTVAVMLELALPGETEVIRRGGLFSKKTVGQLNVTLGEYRYSLHDPGRGPLKATRAHIVRGIALKTEETPMEEWIAEVGAALNEQAKRNAEARDALARFTGSL